MNASSIVIEHQFDPMLLEQIATLRETRIGLLRKQLKDLDGTLKQLITRKLILRDTSEANIKALREELEQKLATLQERQYQPDHVYFDELELYIHMLETTS